jgi:spore maturation protein CgeB
VKPNPSLFLIGHFAEEHMGSHFKVAASEFHLTAQTLDIDLSKSEFSFLNKLAWRLGRKSFWKQSSFQNKIKERFNESRSDILLVTGCSPILKSTLQNLSNRGIKTVNFLTDDPWSLSHRSSRFLEALPEYDLLATPRKSNLEELRLITNKKVIYLPFAYNRSIHFEETNLTPDEENRLSCDVLFFGGADADRLPYIKSIIRAGFSVALFGGYWDRDPETRPYHRGIAPLGTIRKAVKASKVVLNLVRRSNRDGHVMRSFEVPAMGGCMLTEDTEEHREIFSTDNVPFFKTSDEMLDQLKLLVRSPEKRIQFSKKAQAHVTAEKNNYTDRLKTVFDELGFSF